MAQTPSSIHAQNLLHTCLNHITYEKCLHLLVLMNYRLLSPYNFREKMKYLFATNKNRSLLLSVLNSIVPDEFQFSEEEVKQKGADYQELRMKLEPSIEFVNELIEAGYSSEELGNFYELVKKRKHKEFDKEEFYGSVYKLFRCKFGMVNKLGIVLKDRISTSSSVENEVLCVNKKINGSTKSDKMDPFYIYRVDEIIEQSRESMINNDLTSKKGRLEAVWWWETRRNDLDVVLLILKKAEKGVDSALENIKSSNGEQDVELREFLVKNGVRVRLLETMFGEVLESIMSWPQISLPIVVEKLRLKKNEVMNAIKKLDQMRREMKF